MNKWNYKHENVFRLFKLLIKVEKIMATTFFRVSERGGKKERSYPQARVLNCILATRSTLLQVTLRPDNDIKPDVDVSFQDASLSCIIREKNWDSAIYPGKVKYEKQGL